MTTCTLAALIALQTIQPPQNQAPAAPAAGTATIRGHVFAADTGGPMRKAQVRIFSNEIRETRLATTDEQGAYEFTEVRPGRYTITASKGSYVSVSYGQARPTDVARPIEILDRQTVERLDLSLPRGGVVTGRIVDDTGEPLSDVTVSVQRYQFVQGRRTLVPSGRMTGTNDLGEFRLFGIPPGQYYLTATWRNTGIAPQANSSPADRIAFPTTYFPGATDPSAAQRFTIGAGREITDLVMVLRPTKAARISGTVADHDGKPMPGAMVMATRQSAFAFDFAGNGLVRPDGTFALNGLAPGDYTLRVQRPGVAGDGAETATLNVTVNGEDLTDVHLVASLPTAATGRLIVDPAVAAQLPRTLSLALFPAGSGILVAPPPPPVRVNDDYSFELKSPPGAMRVSFGGLGPSPPGWTIKAVRVNGVDVTDSGIEFRPNEDLTGVEVELTNRLSTVSGSVTSGGDPVKDYTVVVFAQDKQKWTAGSRYVGVARPDQDGRFKSSNLPPGDYYAVAVDRVDPGQWTDPEFLDSVRPRAAMFSLMEGETKTIDLKLALQQ